MLKAAYKGKIFTIPNILSMFRILLLPLMVWLYIFRKNYIATILVLLVSGLSDILDGIIARKYNMVSDFGKILDPVADKVTQGILLICLIFRHTQVLVIFGIFVLKEAIMILMGYIVIKKNNVINSAKWYGKLNTVIIYSSIFLMIIIPDIPENAVNAMVLLCSAVIIVSFFMYANFYKKILEKENNICR